VEGIEQKLTIYRPLRRCYLDLFRLPLVTPQRVFLLNTKSNMKKDYQDFLKEKQKTFIESGFEIDETKLNPLLKDFQKYGLQVSLRKFDRFWLLFF